MQRSGLPLLLIAGVALLVAAGVVFLIANPFDESSDSPPRPSRQDDSQAEETASEPEPSTQEPDPPAAEETESESQPAETEAATETQTATDPEPQASTEAEPAVDRAPDSMPEPEPATQPSRVGSGPRTGLAATSVEVRGGDSLYAIAGRIWDDPFLWPLLLAANDSLLTDPDYLRPGSSIVVPEWVDIDSPLSSADRATLSEAHVVAYEHYRDLGSDAVGLGQGQPQWWLDRLGRTRENNAQWVLYSGLRYQESLLEDFSARIGPEDLSDVRGYVTRFGLPPNRR